MGKNIQKVSRHCQPIPEHVIASGWRGLVHVKGWLLGTRFKLVDCVNGVYYLRTPKTGRSYETTNVLLTTRRTFKAVMRLKSKSKFPASCSDEGNTTAGGNVPHVSQQDGPNA